MRRVVLGRLADDPGEPDGLEPRTLRPEHRSSGIDTGPFTVFVPTFVDA